MSNTLGLKYLLTPLQSLYRWWIMTFAKSATLAHNMKRVLGATKCLPDTEFPLYMDSALLAHLSLLIHRIYFGTHTTKKN